MSRYKECLCLLAWLFYLSSASAQVVDAAKTDSIQFYVITPSVKVVHRSTAIPFDSILTPYYQQQFELVKDSIVTITRFGDDYYWYKISIVNTKPKPRELVLNMGPTGMRDAEVFTQQNGKWISLGKTGHQYPFIKRPFQHMHYAYLLPLKADGVSTFYIRQQYDKSVKQMGFALVKPKTFQIFQNRVYFLFGIVTGLLALFCVFNIYIYFTNRETINLWYALHIALLIYIVFRNDQLEEQLLGLDSVFGFRFTNLLSLGAISIGVLMQVVQLFLKNIPRTHFLNRITDFVKWNVIVAGLAHMLIFYLKAPIPLMNVTFSWADISTLTGITFIIINCLYSFAKGFRAALFILAGLFGFLIGAVDKLLLLPTEYILFPPSIIHVGIIIEIVAISFGLVYTYRLERKRKMEFDKSLAIEFEKAREEIQENTFRSISQEIHDNIGQVLTLAKLTINTIDADDRKQVRHKIGSFTQLVEKAVGDLHDLSHTLSTNHVKELGLVKSMEHEINMLRNTGSYQIEFKREGTEYNLSHHNELIFFRVFQEAISNIIKHADASTIWIHLNFQPSNFEMSISDNGAGFNYPDC